ncbi:fibronectin type III domain-containing protein, partial [Candidatus Woesearchaeota archaeon]|nr:fibronectin type III domain-containing protein [Candidatus Woesearchaeota archaeon]
MKIKNLNRIMALILIELIIILPVYSAALTISNIKVEEVSDKSALVTWQTDEAATTKVNYGRDLINLNKTESDVVLVRNHSVLLKNLDKSTAYFFELSAQTATEKVVDNNTGEFYKFVTLAEDTVAPFIDVEIPSFVDTNELDIVGMTEINTLIELFVNGQAVTKTTFDDGEVTLYGVNLRPNQQNTILIRAIDAAGNTAEKTFNVFSDLVDPRITLT